MPERICGLGPRLPNQRREDSVISLSSKDKLYRHRKQIAIKFGMARGDREYISKGSGSHRGGALHLARIHGTEEDRVNCPFYFKIGIQVLFRLNCLFPHISSRPLSPLIFCFVTAHILLFFLYFIRGLSAWRQMLSPASHARIFSNDFN